MLGGSLWIAVILGNIVCVLCSPRLNYVCSSRSLADGEQFCGADAAPPPLTPTWMGGGGGGCAGGDLSGIEGWTNRTRSASVDAALLLAAAAPAAALKADVKAVAAQRVW